MQNRQAADVQASRDIVAIDGAVGWWCTSWSQFIIHLQAGDTSIGIAIFVGTPQLNSCQFAYITTGKIYKGVPGTINGHTIWSTFCGDQTADFQLQGIVAIVPATFVDIAGGDSGHATSAERYDEFTVANHRWRNAVQHLESHSIFGFLVANVPNGKDEVVRTQRHVLHLSIHHG